jgi:hypothetical protein
LIKTGESVETAKKYPMPIELRVNKHPNGGYTYYTVDKVYEGVGNVSYGQRKFMTRKDVSTYCSQEWTGVPVINSY